MTTMTQKQQIYGDPKTNPSLGDLARFKNHCCVWATCSICGKERWVRTTCGGLPTTQTCKSCTTDETRQKLHLKELGKKHSPERIAKNIASHLGRVVSIDTRRKISIATKGRKLSQATKDKLSLAHRALWSDPNFRTRTMETLQSLSRTPEARAKRQKSAAKTARKRWHDYVSVRETRITPKELRTASIGNTGDIVRTRSGVSMKIVCEICNKDFWVRLAKGLPRNTLCKSCAGKVMRVTHAPTFEAAKIKWQKSMRGCIHMRPNKAERQLLYLLCELYPSEWSFVGNWSMTLAGKNPDFVNTNGKKLIVELFGDYWHRGENPEDRISLFSKFGYRTLIVWESELKDILKLTERVQEFVRND